MMSKDILEKNLKAMEKWYPSFSEAIREKKYEKDELDIHVECSEDGEIIFSIDKDGRTLYLNGRRNAKEPVEIWAERIGEIHKYAPVFLLGIGSGSYLKRLFVGLDKTVTVVVYEPSMTIFLRVLEEVDLSEEIESRPIAFIVEGLNETEFHPVVEKLVSFETVEFLKQEIHPNYQELFPEKIVETLRVIEKRTSDLFVNVRTGVNFSAYLARNQMQNMEFVCDGYNTKNLSDVIPHDGPAILVAAGPSLDTNIHQLKKAKNKAFILAVDTAVKPLLQAGIMPDAFVTIDPKKPLNLVEVDAIKDTPVIAPITANYDIVKQQRGKKIFYFDGYMLAMSAYMSVGKIMPSVSTGGSVACSGFSLLYKMGFDTIILVGQDLAYTNNKSHADGTFQKVMPKENTDGMIRVKGNYEDELPTLTNLKLYLDWFNMYIKGAKEHREKFRVINATAGGAYIENTELMALEEAIDKTCTKEVDFGACIENMQSEFDESERKKILEYVHGIPKELEDIRKEAKNLCRSYRKIQNICKSGKVDKNAYLNLLKKTKKAQKKCEGISAYQLIIASMPVAEFVVKSESLYERDTLEDEGIAIATQGMRFAKMLEQCAGILKEYADEILLPIG